MSTSKKSVTVVVRGLPVGTSKEQLSSLCSSLEGLLEVVVPEKATRKKRSSFGFARFTAMEEAQAAIQHLNKSTVDGKVIYAELGHDHPKNTNYFSVFKGPSASSAVDSDENEPSERKINDKVLQICCAQWEKHRQATAGRGATLPKKSSKNIEKYCQC
ncbi:uncharacterized protein LOC143033871 isoform X2 [Oratosquilla oratoria]|uniref:uncharacterized protein LOC143033871 isoform X2 n=1 Tax=Oratosquilla oratoria TaxID=337810 RepID=UPI003F7732D6